MCLRGVLPPSPVVSIDLLAQGKGLARNPKHTKHRGSLFILVTSVSFTIKQGALEKVRETSWCPLWQPGHYLRRLENPKGRRSFEICQALVFSSGGQRRWGRTWLRHVYSSTFMCLYMFGGQVSMHTCTHMRSMSGIFLSYLHLNR